MIRKSLYIHLKNFMLSDGIINRIRIDKNLTVAIALAILMVFFLLMFVDIGDSFFSFVMSLDIDFLIVYGYLYFVKKEKNWFNPYSFCWLSISLFSFGHVILYSLGLEAPKFFLFDSYPLELVNEYLIFGFLSLIALLFSGVFVINSQIESCMPKLHLDTDVNAKRIFLIMLLISMPFYLYRIFTLMKMAMMYGYGDVFEMKGSVVVAIFAMWFVPALFGLIYLYKDSFFRYFFLGLSLIPIVCPLIIGTRSKPFAIVLCLLFLWNSGIKKLTKLQVFCVSFIGFLFLFLTPSIAEYRTSTNSLSFFDILTDNFTLGLTDVSSKFLGEFGGSANIWMRLRDHLLDIYGYNYGLSYLSSVLCIFPSILFGGFSFAKYANLSTWITEAEKTSYGLGFSMLGESFYNFGWLGVVGIFFVGLFIFYSISCFWLPQILVRYKYVFSSIALYIFSTTGRDSMYLSVRHIFYCIVIPALLIYLTREKH